MIPNAKDFNNPDFCHSILVVYVNCGSFNGKPSPKAFLPISSMTCSLPISSPSGLYPPQIPSLSPCQSLMHSVMMLWSAMLVSLAKDTVWTGQERSLLSKSLPCGPWAMGYITFLKFLCVIFYSLWDLILFSASVMVFLHPFRCLMNNNYRTYSHSLLRAWCAELCVLYMKFQWILTILCHWYYSPHILLILYHGRRGSTRLNSFTGPQTCLVEESGFELDLLTPCPRFMWF